MRKYFDSYPYICVKLFDCNIIPLLESSVNKSLVRGKGLNILDNFDLQIDSPILKEVITPYGTNQSVQG